MAFEVGQIVASIGFKKAKDSDKIVKGFVSNSEKMSNATVDGSAKSEKSVVKLGTAIGGLSDTSDKSTAKTSKSFEGLRKSLGVAIGGIVGVLSTIGAKIFGEKSVEKKKILNNFKAIFRGVLDEADEAAIRISKKLVVTITQAKSLLANTASKLKLDEKESVKQSERLLNTAKSISRVYGKDLPGVIEALASAVEGSFGGISDILGDELIKERKLAKLFAETTGLGKTPEARRSASLNILLESLQDINKLSAQKPSDITDAVLKAQKVFALLSDDITKRVTPAFEKLFNVIGSIDILKISKGIDDFFTSLSNLANPFTKKDLKSIEQVASPISFSKLNEIGETIGEGIFQIVAKIKKDRDPEVIRKRKEISDFKEEAKQRKLINEDNKSHFNQFGKPDKDNSRGLQSKSEININNDVKINIDGANQNPEFIAQAVASKMDQLGKELLSNVDVSRVS